MSLREELDAAIEQWFEDKVMAPSGDWEEVATLVWSILEERVGTVQEKLLEDLAAVRSELQAAHRREEALVATLRGLQEG